jgi:hypothetical protein
MSPRGEMMALFREDRGERDTGGKRLSSAEHLPAGGGNLFYRKRFLLREIVIAYK